MSVWSGVKTAKFITNVDAEKDIQPNGVDLKVSEVYSLSEKGRKLIVGAGFKKVCLKPTEAYVIRFLNGVTIPQGACGIFLPRSTMWRKKGLIICHSLFDTGYVGHPECFIKPTFNVYLREHERIGQIIYMDADITFKYAGQYSEENYAKVMSL